ncbi:MAG: LapA family protein [Bacillota bacterium]
MQFTVILTLIFAIIIAIFAGLNSAVVTLNLLVTQFEISLAIVILISAVLGAIIMYLVNIFKSLKKSKKIKNLKKEKSSLNDKINNLHDQIVKKDEKIDKIQKKLNDKETLKDKQK